MLDGVLDGLLSGFLSNNAFLLFLSARETGAVPVGPRVTWMVGGTLPLEVVVEEPLFSPSRLLLNFQIPFKNKKDFKNSTHIDPTLAAPPAMPATDCCSSC